MNRLTVVLLTSHHVGLVSGHGHVGGGGGKGRLGTEQRPKQEQLGEGAGGTENTAQSSVPLSQADKLVPPLSNTHGMLRCPRRLRACTASARSCVVPNCGAGGSKSG